MKYKEKIKMWKLIDYCAILVEEHFYIFRKVLLIMAKNKKINKAAEEEKQPYTLKRFLIDTVQVIGSAFVLTLIILIFIQPCIVDGPSMQPTYYSKDFLIIWKLGDIERNDIIAFDAHTPDNEDYIKRVIAVEGDHLVISNSVVTVNGEVIDEPYIKETTFDGEVDMIISENCVYAMGDNRNDSLDSRRIGEVNLDDVIGKVAINFNQFFRNLFK